MCGHVDWYWHGADAAVKEWARRNVDGDVCQQRDLRSEIEGMGLLLEPWHELSRVVGVAGWNLRRVPEEEVLGFDGRFGIHDQGCFRYWSGRRRFW